MRFGPHPDDGVAEVFTTHLHAPYSSDPEGDSYSAHRAAQAWQLAKLLRAAAERGHLVVAAGDFNITPAAAEHGILTSHAPVRDVWRVLHPESSLGSVHDPRRRAVPTAEANLLTHGATSNSVLNTWRWPRSAQKKLRMRALSGEPGPSTPDPAGKRLDYIFASTAARELPGGEVGGWVVRRARVGMTQRHPELGCSLSDHFSVEATLVFHMAARECGTEGPPSTIHWPLPPGRRSSLSAFRRSTPHSYQGDGTTILTNGNTNRPEAITETDPEDLHSPASGAFLSLQSPTPSTSRQSLPAGQNLTHFPAATTAADFDTQLLSSVSLSTNGVGVLDAMHFGPPDYESLLSMIKEYVSREVSQTRWRICHFCFWVCLTIVCYVVVWFIPTHSNSLSDGQNHAINFVLLLLSSLGLVAGVLDGLMTLLFFRGSEQRALSEFKWEVKNAKALALGETSAHVGDIGGGKY